MTEFPLFLHLDMNQKCNFKCPHCIVADEKLIEDYYNGDGVSAVLFNNEIDPSQPGHWGDDATVEEVIHTINHIGHVNVYPNVFNLQPNSSNLSSKSSGSSPNPVIISSDSPAFLNCFLALNTLDKFAFLTRR